jgi:hypothetical protein
MNTNYRVTLRRIRSLIIFLSFLHLMTVSDVYCQQLRDDTPPLRERIFFGGNFGLQFGTLTDIQISPVVGIWLLPRVSVAAGPDYRFYKYRSDRTDIYGFKAYSELVLIRDLGSVLPVGANTGVFLHLEDEVLSLESAFWKSSPVFSKRFYTNTLLAGGGISQQIGKRGSMNIMILWSLNENIYDVTSYPDIRISFTF